MVNGETSRQNFTRPHNSHQDLRPTSGYGVGSDGLGSDLRVDHKAISKRVRALESKRGEPSTLLRDRKLAMVHRIRIGTLAPSAATVFLNDPDNQKWIKEYERHETT